MRAFKFFSRLMVGGATLLACAMMLGATAAHAERFIHITSVATGTSSNITFGPVGANCNATTGGTACTFFTGDSKFTGKLIPGGRFDATGTFTVFFGLNGARLTPNGAASASGAPAGFCAPEFTTSHLVFADGSSIDSNGTGTDCCDASSCPAPEVLGPPNVTHASTRSTTGTGRYAGVKGTSSVTTRDTGSNTFLSQGEGVLELP